MINDDEMSWSECRNVLGVRRFGKERVHVFYNGRGDIEEIRMYVTTYPSLRLRFDEKGELDKKRSDNLHSIPDSFRKILGK